MTSPLDRLKTQNLGFPLVNPFLLASAPPTASLELVQRAFRLGWGGAVLKTIKPDSMTVSDVSPRFHAVKDGSGEVVGFENIELVSPRDEAYWIETIATLKAEFPDRMVIASLMGDDKPSTWRNLALRLEKAGADALELNFSCPHGMPEKGVGAAIGQNPPIAAEITSWVKAVVRIPVIVKLTPNVTDIRVPARAVAEAGADALAAINTVESILGVDLESLIPFPAIGGRSTYGGYSGAGIKPIGLKAVSQIALAIPLPLHGMGGIRTWSDAAEYIALGADVVQICTEVMVKGFRIIGDLTKGLAAYLETKDLTVGELKGMALPALSRHEDLSRSVRTRASIDTSACTSCSRCVTACRDGGHQAISFRDHRIVVDETRCDGCSLCSHVCPQQAIAMSALPVL